MLARKVVAVAIALGDFRLEGLEDVELGVHGVGFVEVVFVKSLPAEGLAGDALQALQIDGAVLEEIDMFGGEVLPGHRHYSHFREEGGGDAEEDGRPAQHLFPLPEGGVFTLSRATEPTTSMLIVSSLFHEEFNIKGDDGDAGALRLAGYRHNMRWIVEKFQRICINKTRKTAIGLSGKVIDGR